MHCKTYAKPFKDLILAFRESIVTDRLAISLRMDILPFLASLTLLGYLDIIFRNGKLQGMISLIYTCTNLTK